MRAAEWRHSAETVRRSRRAHETGGALLSPVAEAQADDGRNESAIIFLIFMFYLYSLALDYLYDLRSH